MTAATVPGIDATSTTNTALLSWVRDVAELVEPDRVIWCDGSEAEWDRVTSALVAGLPSPAAFSGAAVVLSAAVAWHLRRRAAWVLLALIPVLAVSILDRGPRRAWERLLPAEDFRGAFTTAHNAVLAPATDRSRAQFRSMAARFTRACARSLIGAASLTSVRTVTRSPPTAVASTTVMARG